MTISSSNPDIQDTVAAVDLGSNSFHMIVAVRENGQLAVLDRLRDMVRLGGGLQPDKHLDEAARKRALDSLSRMGQRLRALPHSAVRAVGTNTMRQVRDGGAFLRAAEQALGHPIEIIGGREEARLVYLGVAHGLAPGDGKRLVVDIGGGSTELILGQALEPYERESLFMGCVSMSRRFFADGVISRGAMDSAILAARVELQPVSRMFHAGHWRTAVGSSGTIKAIERVAMANAWSEEGVTRSALKKLRRALVRAGHIDKVRLEGLSDDRQPVFAGGVAVLSAVFKALEIKRMQVSDLALREGLLYEMARQAHPVDVRASTVKALMQRFGVDRKQARRVEATASALLKQVAADWRLDNPEHRSMLEWASLLHEIGLTISHNGFHKHGAYILNSADLPGFSRQQQAVLSALVRAHRRRFAENEFALLPARVSESARRLALLLRLAALLHRGRSGSQQPPMRLTVQSNHVAVRFPRDWLSQHPLTGAEIARESEYLSAAGFTLQYS